MGICDGRVAIVTGAGRGIGRTHALALAQQGARVVVNDIGASLGGEGNDTTPAEQVVQEIRAAGGEAVADYSDISSWEGARKLVDGAIASFGKLDVLVNNAGILRDRMLVNMSEEEWDAVIQVHLKGTFATMRHAAVYWRDLSRKGEPLDARIINTTSNSGLYSNVGQGNYAAAKAGIASLSLVAARELHRFGVRVNSISPRANTRMNENLRPYTEEEVRLRKPEWVSALVAWLASGESRDITGRVFEAWGYGYSVSESWQHGPVCEASLDPSKIGDDIRRIVREARPNAGSNHDSRPEI